MGEWTFIEWAPKHGHLCRWAFSSNRTGIARRHEMEAFLPTFVQVKDRIVSDGASRLQRLAGVSPLACSWLVFAFCFKGFRVGAVLPKWCSAGGCVAVDVE